MCEHKNYCVLCGKKLKDNKKGYSGNNRWFHKDCEKEIDFKVDFHNKCVDDFREMGKTIEKYKNYKTMKDFFFYKHKALKKTEHTSDKSREDDYNEYMKGQKWLMKKIFNTNI